ncbi:MULTISPECIES: Wadjet anti-phage system protein JetD domain-containing protein [unclassified Ketobacter]|uniref:Wadjet anti-phage system protein JetD domain-containing protein n=1 Tax=unclassified Ketobacter TaxID=2639109 RepID=UPI000F1FA224|nr:MULTISPECIES: Wadjet anti-phage system protein JetD domain-containing protein [unclassified Ketobacter]RLT91623.1 MAG: hypothetical protein D9N13_04630 [Ketobacter sp. GenoA1]RLT96097.1 MAG: hypothetical protein D9N15_11590 [Ketobacter sp.]
MKSPSDLAAKLAKQWHRSDVRVERLLSKDAWPLEPLLIGKPSPAQFLHQASEVQNHIQCWKNVSIGEVVWQPVKYRAGDIPIDVPMKWCIRSPSEWARACGDSAVEDEFHSLEFIVEHVNEIYRELLVRERSLWRNKDLDEIVVTAELADALCPGVAQGRPLRLMAGHGVDTKFFERHGLLLTRLLDERYQGEASEQGLLSFLDAYEENDHWVLVVPLERNILPFRRLRVTTSALSESPLPAKNILIVENEQCFHHLPELPHTIAVMGAGLDLNWLGSRIFEGKSIGYWGDMDTWGLLMLARARQFAPGLVPLLMNRSLFERHREGSAVSEASTAGSEPPKGLTDSEASFYCYLLKQDRGRLEQEFLPVDEVQSVLRAWVSGLPTSSPGTPN